MKLSFPDRISVGVSSRKQVESSISWLIVIGFLAAVGGSYLLGNHVISLIIVVLGIGSILVGVAILTLLNGSKVDRTHSVPIKKKVPRIISEWHYRPREATRAYAAVDSAGAAASEVLSPDPFGISNNVWCNDNSLECAAPTFISGRLDAEELMPKVLSETPDPVCTAPTVDDVAVSMYD